MRNIGEMVWVVNGYQILRAEITKVVINKGGPIHYYVVEDYHREHAEIEFGVKAELHSTLDEAIKAVKEKLSRDHFADTLRLLDSIKELKEKEEVRNAE